MQSLEIYKKEEETIFCLNLTTISFVYKNPRSATIGISAYISNRKIRKKLIEMINRGTLGMWIFNDKKLYKEILLD